MTNNNSKENFWEELWIFFGSAKLAVLMVVILAIVSALGTLIPQGESHDFYVQKFGEALGHLILNSGISDLYHQGWFIFLLFILAVNLVVSSIKRYKNLKDQANKLKINLGVLFFQKYKNIKFFKSSLNLEELQKKLEEILKSLHYKIKKETDQNGNIFYYAQKGVFKKWGSFYTHLGILIIFLGAIYGNLPGKGFSKYINISEGKTFKVPEGDFSLKLKKFTVKFDQKGRPLDFASVVDLLDFNNKLVLSKTIRVNNPLEYQGIKFYQSNYGVDNIQMEITSPKGSKEKITFPLDPQGRVPMENAVHQIFNSPEYIFVHYFFPDYAEVNQEPANLSNNPLNPAILVYLNKNFKKTPQKWESLGWIFLHQPFKYQNYIFNLTSFSKFSGFSYRKDPGVPIVWLGFGIIMLGLVLSFYINFKYLRMLLLQEKDALKIYLLHGEEEGFNKEITFFQEKLK